MGRGSTASSCSSRRRLKLEAEIAEDESCAKIERKQQELELRRKQREMELEAQKEEEELAERKREEKLSPKFEKMEMMGRTSSGGSVSSIIESLRCQNVTTSTWVKSAESKFGPQRETKLGEELQDSYNSERPWSWR